MASLRKRRLTAAYVMLIPAFLYFVLFVYYPVFQLFRLSVLRYSLFGTSDFLGLRNFLQIFHDTDFFSAVTNTVYYSVATTVVSIVLAFIIALMIERSTKSGDFYKIVYFVPYISPMVSVSLVWEWLLDPSKSGLVNYVLSIFSIQPQSWLHNTSLAMPSLIAITIWRETGYQMLIFAAGLKAIPRQYFEAAQVAGASVVQTVRYVTLPLLLPIFQFVLIIMTLTTFKGFIPMYVLTHGGPVGTTKTVVYLIYEVAFQFNKLGYASAEALLLFVALLALAAIQRRLTGNR